jgi:hypothetical protein
MDILFVSMVAFENNTSATIQNKGIVRGLAEIGHNVDILTLQPDQRAISYDNSMNDISELISNAYYIEIDSRYAVLMAKKDLKNESSNSRIRIFKNILRKGRKVVKMIYDNISVFDAQKVNVKGVSKLNINYSKYDIIVSASDPKSSHLIVEKILKKNKNCKAKWIQYWGDPMLHDITRKRDWRNSLVKYCEGRLLSKADKVIYASPLTSEKQKETFVESSLKMDYASQVYVHSLTEKSGKVQNKSELSEIEVGYFGAYSSSIRNILPLYNAAIMGGFHLDICGYSDVLLESTNNITVHGLVPYNEVVKMEKKADVLVCISNSKGTQIPGKIYYSVSYNKPIIVVLDSEYQEELREYFKTFDRYIICENNWKSIINAIEKAKFQLKKNDFYINEQLTPQYLGRKILGEHDNLTNLGTTGIKQANDDN